MFQHDPLNRGPHLHVLFCGFPLLQRAIETRAAHFCQLTHSLNAQIALHRHQLPDLLEDSIAPVLPPFWRRAPTFCKAPLKTSASSTFSPSTRLSSRTCLRSSRSPEFAGGSYPSSAASIALRHLYSWVR